jgi:cytochrome c-type biogenesis protein CcmE
MKKSHIVLIILVAVISGILVTTYISAERVGTFRTSRENPSEQIQITGTFDKQQPVEYDALNDADLTIFYMIDKEGESQKVMLRDKHGMPKGLEMSESLTIKGKIGDDGNFHANHLLMKCPSKYDKQKHQLSAE